jgi:hypothetical protein
LLIDPEYVYRVALAMPDRRDFFRSQVIALRRRRKLSAEVQFQLILTNRFFESVALTASPSRLNDALYGDFAWQARGLDFHQKFLVMLVVYCKKVERKEEDATLKFRLLGYLRGQESVDSIPFQGEYSSSNDPEKAQVRASDFKAIVRWSMPWLAEVADLLGMLIRFVGFPEAVAWIANSDFQSLDAVRRLLEAAGPQALQNFWKADTRHSTPEWDQINVESLVSLVEILVLYHRLGLGALVVTDDNLAYFEAKIALAYNGRGKTIAWPYRRSRLGNDERVIVRCVVTDPLIDAKSSDLMELLLPRIQSACPGTGEQRHQVAVRSLFENSIGKEGASLETAFMDLKETPLWGEVLNPLWLLQNIRFIEGHQMSFEDARSFIQITPSQFFRHRILWAIELMLRHVSDLWLRVAGWRSSDKALSPHSLRDSALHYLQGRPEALAFFLAQANQSVHKGSTGTVENYRAELLRFQQWIHAMSPSKLRRFICGHFKIKDYFIKPSTVARFSTLRTLLLVRRFLRYRAGAAAPNFRNFVEMSYALLFDKPTLFEWLWPSIFAYYIDDVAAYLKERGSRGIRLLGSYYACWVWRVSYYLADRLVLSRRTYEDFVQVRFETEFHTGSSAQSPYLPRDAVPGYTATRSGRRWLRWGFALLVLAVLVVYAGFLHTSTSYTFRDAFKPAAFLSYLSSTLELLVALKAEPGLVLDAAQAGTHQIGRGVLSGLSGFPWNWAESGSKGVAERVGLLFGSLVAFAASSWVAGHLCIWLASVIPFSASQVEDREEYIAIAITSVVGLIGIVWLVFLCLRLL